MKGSSLWRLHPEKKKVNKHLRNLNEEDGLHSPSLQVSLSLSLSLSLIGAYISALSPPFGYVGLNI
jgi:hypothetical protein